MLHLTLCVAAIWATAAAVPPTGDDDPYPPIGLLNRTAETEIGRSVKISTPYSAFLKDIKVAEEKVRVALLLQPPEASDPKLHVLLVLGVVDAYANRLLDPNNNNDLESGYKSLVNKQLPLLLKNPVQASIRLAVDLSVVKLALEPLLTVVESLCDGTDDKTCDELVQLTVDRRPELSKSVDVLNHTYTLAEQYLSLVKEIELAAKKLSGVGYCLNNVPKLASLSQQFSNVLVYLKSSSTTAPTPYSVPTSTLNPFPTFKPTRE